MRFLAWLAGLIIVWASLLELTIWWQAFSVPQIRKEMPADESALAIRGEYLVRAGGCVSCHVGKDGVTLSGGKEIKTAYGSFFVPNITADMETGIGGWSHVDFIRAVRYGVSPDGTRYYAAFPFTSYTGVSDEDALAMRAYLLSQQAVRFPNRDHQLRFPVDQRWLNRYWQAIFFRPAHFAVDPARTERWNRGAYLVRHLGHCGECHTKRNIFGVRDQRHHLAGSAGFPGPEDRIPNITPHQDGIADWRHEDLTMYMEIGMDVEGDFAGGEMANVIDHNLSKLTTDDRQAIAEYLLSLEALPDPDN